MAEGRLWFRTWPCHGDFGAPKGKKNDDSPQYFALDHPFFEREIASQLDPWSPVCAAADVRPTD
jgi:hypothetical protein